MVARVSIVSAEGERDLPLYVDGLDELRQSVEAAALGAASALREASSASLAATSAEAVASTAAAAAAEARSVAEAAGGASWSPVSAVNTSVKNLRAGIWESGIPLTVQSDNSGLITTGGSLGYFHVNEAGVYLIGAVASLQTSPDAAAQLTIYGATSFAAAGRTEEYRFHGYGNGLISGSVATLLEPDQFLGFGMRDSTKANVLPAGGLRVTISRIS